MREEPERRTNLQREIKRKDKSNQITEGDGEEERRGEKTRNEDSF
jgi:hypothetical protein